MPSPSAAGNTRDRVRARLRRAGSAGSPGDRTCSRRPGGAGARRQIEPRRSRGSASRSGSHPYWKQPRGPRSIRQISEPLVVTVAAIGTPRSIGRRSNVFDQLPLFATMPVKSVQRERGGPGRAVGLRRPRRRRRAGRRPSRCPCRTGRHPRPCLRSRTRTWSASSRLELAHQRGDAGDEGRRHRRAALDDVGRRAAGLRPADRDAGRHDVGLDPVVDRRAAAGEGGEVRASDRTGSCSARTTRRPRPR